MDRVDDQAVEVDRLAVEPPGDRAREDAVDPHTEKRLAALLEVAQRLAQGRYLVRSDQLRLDPVGPPLELDQLCRDPDVGEVERGRPHASQATPPFASPLLLCSRAHGLRGITTRGLAPA